MRKAAGIILIALGVSFLWFLINVLLVFGIGFLIVPFLPVPPQNFIAAIVVLGTIVPAAFYVTGGIFCLRRKYWGVCLASASFAVLFSVVYSAGFSGSNIIRGLINWVMLVAAVVAVVFIVHRKREWQAISDSVNGKVSYGG